MCTKNSSKKKIDRNFLEVIKVLNKKRINYWICHGTLLGIIRDNNLIPWDHDIDIAVWSSSSLRKKILSIMINKKYKLKKKYFNNDLLTFVKKGGREIDINFYLKKKYKNKMIAYIRWYAPKNFFFKLIDAISSSSKYEGKYKFFIKKLYFLEYILKKIKIFFIEKKIFYKTVGYTQPISLLEKFKKISFHGVKLSIPHDEHKYLEYVYGPNWKKPIKKFNWIKDSPSTKEI